MSDLVLSNEQLYQLASPANGLCISLYLPTHIVGRAIQQDRVRFKKLLSKAGAELRHLGMSPVETEAILQPAHNLIPQSLFWQHQRHSLAVLLAPASLQTHRLPYRCKQLIVVSNSFHIKPLIPLVHADDRFHVLAVSQKDVRLFSGTRYAIEEIIIEGKPTGLQEALQLDFPEKHLQYHTRTRNAPGHMSRPARFHGQGMGTSKRKTHMLHYFRKIDKCLKKELHPEKKVPLLLASVNYLAPIYREANSYQYLVDETLSGNPDRLSSSSLHREAWKIIKPQLHVERHEFLAKYREMIARKDKNATVNIEEIVRSAWQGQVRILFVAINKYLWGSYDPHTSVLTRHNRRLPGDSDLLNDVAVRTLQFGGNVYAVAQEDMPADVPSAAILRFPPYT